MGKKKYIHYGHREFLDVLWNDVSGSESGFGNKPHGGLWASPKDARFGWYDWCSRANFCTENLDVWFEFSLKRGTRILKLTPDNVWELPVTEEYKRLFGTDERSNMFSGVQSIDFKKLSEDYDVLEYCVSKYPELYWRLYGWDCDCILVLNKDVIKV